MSYRNKFLDLVPNQVHLHARKAMIKEYKQRSLLFKADGRVFTQRQLHNAFKKLWELLGAFLKRNPGRHTLAELFVHHVNDGHDVWNARIVRLEVWPQIVLKVLTELQQHHLFSHRSVRHQVSCVDLIDYIQRKILKSRNIEIVAIRMKVNVNVCAYIPKVFWCCEEPSICWRNHSAFQMWNCQQPRAGVLFVSLLSDLQMDGGRLGL